MNLSKHLSFYSCRKQIVKMDRTAVKQNNLPGKRSSLQHRLLSWVLAICLSVGVVSGLWIIFSEEQKIVSSAHTDLERICQRYADTLRHELSRRQDVGLAANRIVLHSISQPLPASARTHLGRDSKGAVREASGVSGAFLAAGTPWSAEIASLFRQSEIVWEKVAPLVQEDFFNFYLIGPHDFIRISPPDWAMEVEADHSFADDIFFSIATPEENPQRLPLWTPVYYDSIWKKWMTSLIIPLYDRERFLGITGSDFILDDIFQKIKNMSEREGWGVGMLVDDSGSMLVHPDYMEAILAKQAEMNTRLAVGEVGDPSLQRLIDAVVSSSVPAQKAHALGTKNDTIHFCFQRIEPQGWNLVVYASHQEITGNLAALRWKILGTILSIAFLLSLILHFSFRRLILLRLQTLAGAVSKMEKGELDVPVSVCRNDDLGLLESGFTRMRDAIREQIDELAREIHFRKQAEKELRDNEEKYREIFNAPAEAIFVHDAETGRILEVNQTMLNMYGYTREEALECSVGDLSLNQPPFSNEDAKVKLQQAMREGPQLFTWRSRKKSGVLFWSDVALKYVDIGGNKRIIAVVRDITSRKEAEDALLKEKEFSENLINSQIDTVFVFDAASGNPIRWNRQVCDVTGYSDAEIRAMKLLDFHPPEEHDRIAEVTEELLRTGKRRVEFLVRTKSGRCLPYEFNASLIRDEVGTPQYVCSVGRDMGDRLKAEEEKRKLEERLRHAHKLEAIGTLAGGIAHDFNNLLTAIIGYAELAKLRTGTPAGSIDENIQAILQAGHRAKELVRQILTFSRQSEQKKMPTPVVQIVREVLKLIRATIPSTIEIVVEIPEQGGTVFADPSQINQVILNLCTNAVHAMEDKGGRLTLALENVMVENGGRLSAGPYVKLTVSDSGQGIGPKALERIFDPYFTTKETGKGTGLGLSVVHGIVRGLHGDIEVKSTLGRGTTFTVLLPRIEEEEVEEEVAEPPPEGGSERVLVVDDESAIVDFEKLLLQEFGYEVVGCTSPSEAFEVFSQAPQNFDLIITDQTMPKMTGLELAQACVGVRNDIPIILCSGYSSLVTEQSVFEAGIRRYIMKPVVSRELVGLVREVLDENPSAT